MIFHVSLPADEPERVARVVAEIWRGEAFPFPPWPGAWVAMADDARRTTLEIYPRTHVVTPGEGTGIARPRVQPSPDRYGCFHAAVATDRSVDEILAIGAREGWRAARCPRGGVFEVVELWLEGVTLIEVLTEEMQAAYRANMGIEAWRTRLRDGYFEAFAARVAAAS